MTNFDKHRTQKDSLEDLRQADELVQSLIPKRDGNSSITCPMWHGWALRECYLIGLRQGREQGINQERTKGEAKEKAEISKGKRNK
jgi:hypothetical protein